MRRLLFDRSMLMVGMSLPDRSGVVAIRRRRRRGRHLWSILLMPYFFRFIYLFIFVVDRCGVPLVQCRHIRYTLNIFSICGTHSHIADVYDTKEKERRERRLCESMWLPRAMVTFRLFQLFNKPHFACLPIDNKHSHTQE